MRIPLLISATVSLIKNTPIVRVPSGRWEIIVQNHEDSVYSVLIDADTLPARGLFDGPCDAQVLIKECGSERNLSIYASEVIV